MVRIKLFITAVAFATVIVAGLNVQGMSLALWSVACIFLGWALTELWKLKKPKQISTPSQKELDKKLQDFADKYLK